METTHSTARLGVVTEFGWNGPGEPAQLSHKAKQLIGLLAFEHPEAMERRVLELLLWPTVPFENRQMSLRQALTNIRKFLGPVVCSDRSSVWLNPDFPLECDLWKAPRVRPHWLPQEPVEYAVRADSPCTSLAELLRWHTIRRPERAVSLLAGECDLAMGIDLAEMGNIVRQLDRSRGEAPENPWLHYYWAWSVWERDSRFSSNQLLRALRAAGDDAELRARAAYFLAGLLCQEGQTAKAERVAHSVSATLPPAMHHLKGYLLAAQGTARIHQGRIHEGTLDTASALPLFDDAPVESAVHHGLHALYLATNGQAYEANSHLARAENAGYHLDHARLDGICTLTRIMLAQRNHDYELAQVHAEKLLSSCFISFEIYAEEALTLNAFRRGDRLAAKDHWSRVVRRRQSAKMRFTEWDRTRLMELGPRLKVG